MAEKVLFVDDEKNILTSFRRSLHRIYRIYTTTSPLTALKIISAHKPFKVVVVDYRMPEMDGLNLIKKIKSRFPHTQCILLTGNADLKVALEAVNQGGVYRFLLKPFPVAELPPILNDAIHQYELLEAEKELLTRTLRGSIKVLMDLLALVKPEIFSLSRRIKETAVKLGACVHLEKLWEVELAGYLSLIGALALPEEVISKRLRGTKLTPKEINKFNSHPEIGYELLSHIPRLENIARAIRYQNKHYNGSGYPADQLKGTQIPLLARILHIAIDFELYKNSGLSPRKTIEKMKTIGSMYDPWLFAFLENEIVGKAKDRSWQTIPLEEAKVGMKIAEDIRTKDGMLVVTSGTPLSSIFLTKLKNLAQKGLIQPKVKILVFSEKTDNL